MPVGPAPPSFVQTKGLEGVGSPRVMDICGNGAEN